MIWKKTYLAVPVRDMTTIFALSKSSNHITQGTETAIDILSLFETFACRPAMAQALATSQVDQVQSTLTALASDMVLANEL